MRADERPLRIALDAHLVSGEPGGVEQVIIGLAQGFSALADGDEQYYFLTNTGDQSWLEPYMGGACRMVHDRPSPEPAAWKRMARQVVPFAAPLWRRLRYGSAEPKLGLPLSDGTAESLHADVVHFPQQKGFRTEIPSVYHPHDLQHLHLAEFFTAEQIAVREATYRAMCEQAAMVTMTSMWGRRDLIEHYGLSDDKVVVIQLAPAIGAYAPASPAAMRAVAQRHHLPGQFIFYPAQTWPHKNHLRLLEALALLRARDGIEVSLVCSGRLNEHYAKIAKHATELGVQDLVHFLGFVEPEELRALYSMATAVVIPSMFEAFGGFGPLSEAFLAGTPAACSNVTSLPDEAGDAALLFDPTDVSAIADATRRLWTDAELRDALVKRGTANVSRFTWDRTARIFRAHYRRIAGRVLGDEDQALIAAPPAF